MRLPDSAHASRPWRIHEITPEFRIEDVWALPTPGGPGDFPRLVQMIAAVDPSQSSSRASRALFAIRWKVGELFGWRAQRGAPATLRSGCRATCARARPGGPAFDTLPFKPLYLLDDEWAAEIANRTMHGVIHVGWVEDETAEGGYRGQMAVLVQAEWTPRPRLHGRDRAVPAPDHLPADDERGGAEVASVRKLSSEPATGVPSVAPPVTSPPGSEAGV